MSLNANDVVRLTLYLTAHEGDIANLVFHYLATAGSGADEGTVLTDLADHLETALTTVASRIKTTVGTYAAVMWKWNTSLHQWDGVASEATTGFVGTGTGDVYTQQVAGQIDFHTDVPRRQGRKYILGFDEVAITAGELAAATITNMLTCAALMDNAVISDGVTFAPGVYNTDSASNYYEVFEVFNGTVGVETYTSTQRKRKPGVGI